MAEYVGPDLEHLAEYPPENRPAGYIRQSELQAGADALKGLSKEECPHEYFIPLYDSEGEVIGKYRNECHGHFDTTGMTMEEVREAIIRGDYKSGG